MKENRCSHCENANKPQSNLTGMAEIDLDRHYVPWLWKDAERTKRATKTDKGQNTDSTKKIHLCSSKVKT